MQTMLLLFSLVFAVPSPCRAQTQPTEYQIKAAFIYNFARFVDWPPQAFATANAPMVIGVLGENPFGDNLQQAINGKVVNGHPLQFRQFDSLSDALKCHVLFISQSEKKHLSKIIAKLKAAPILTIGETDGFIDAGGMIHLVLIQQKVRFQINNEAAKNAGLTMSSKLLSLAMNNQ